MFYFVMYLPSIYDLLTANCPPHHPHALTTLFEQSTFGSTEKQTRTWIASKYCRKATCALA